MKFEKQGGGEEERRIWSNYIFGHFENPDG